MAALDALDRLSSWLMMHCATAGTTCMMYVCLPLTGSDMLAWLHQYAAAERELLCVILAPAMVCMWPIAFSVSGLPDAPLHTACAPTPSLCVTCQASAAAPRHARSAGANAALPAESEYAVRRLRALADISGSTCVRPWTRF